MQLLMCNLFRLYAVSETPDEHGQYNLVPFRNNTFNQDIDESKTNEVLEGLVDAFYEQGGWYEIADKIYDGVIRIDLDDDERLEVRDIIDQINTDPDRCRRLYILVDAECTEYQWVVAVPQGTVYSG